MSTSDFENVPAQPLRFTLRRLLMATFWMAICCGAWTTILRVDAKTLSQPLVIVVVYVATTAPLLAIGELFDRKVSGILLLTSGWLLLLGLGVLMVG